MVVGRESWRGVSQAVKNAEFPLHPIIILSLRRYFLALEHMYPFSLGADSHDDFPLVRCDEWEERERMVKSVTRASSKDEIV
jgi:hypothetical protein